MADQKSNNVEIGKIVNTALGAFSEVAPFTTNSANSVLESIKEMRKTSTRTQSAMRQQNQQIKNNAETKNASKIFNTAFADLASGKLEIGKIGDNVYKEYNNQISQELENDDENPKSTEDIINSGNRAVSKSIIASSAATVDAISASTEALIKSNMKATKAASMTTNSYLLTGFNALNVSLTQVNQKLNSIDHNIKSLVEFNNKNTNEYYKSSMKLMGMLSQTIENTNTQLKKNGGNDDFMSSRGMDIGKYSKYVKGNLEKSFIGSLLGLGKTVSSSGGVANVAKSTLNTMLAPAVDMFLKDSIKNTMGMMDKRVNAYFDEALKALGESSPKNPLLQLLGIGDIFGTKRGRVNSINMGMFNKDSMTWNGIAQKTLVEVIPELLTSIDSKLDGSDKRYMDYETGVFKTRKEIQKEFNDVYATTIQSSFDTKIEKLVAMLAERGQDSEATIKQIETLLNKRINDKVGKSTYDNTLMSILGTSGFDKNAIKDTVLSLESSIEGVKKEINSFYENIGGNSSSIYRNINNRSDGKQAYTKMGDRNIALSFGRSSNQSYSRIINNVVSKYKLDMSILNAADKSYLNKSVSKMVAQNIPEYDIEKFITDYHRQYLFGAMQSEAMQRASGFVFGGFKRRDADGNDRFGRYADGRFLPEGSGISTGIGSYGNGKIGQWLSRMDDKAFDRLYGDIDLNDMYDFNENIPQSQRQRVSVSSRRRQPVKITSRAPRQSTNVTPQPTKRSNKVTSTGLQTMVNKVEDVKPELKNTRIDDVISKMHDMFIKDGLDIQSFTSDDIRKFNIMVDQGVDEISRGTDAFGFSQSIEQSIKNLNDTTRLSMMTILGGFQSFVGTIVGEEGIGGKSKEEKAKENQKKMQEKLFNEETGVFKNQVKSTKEAFNEMKEKTKGHLYDAYDFVYDNFQKYKYGESYKTNQAWKNNEFAQKLNLKSKYQESLAEKAKAAEAANGLKSTNSSDKEGETQAEQITTNLAEAVNATEVLKSSTNAIAETVVGDTEESPADKKKTFINQFSDGMKKMKSHLPKVAAGAIIGAGVGMASGGSVGLLGSLFLPGGPVAGAIVGAGLTILSKTETFQNIMFGKADDDGKRTGGLISEKMRASFKKALPAMVTGGVLGALKGTILPAMGFDSTLGILGMSILPGGPVGGALMGMGFSLLKNNEKFKEMLFGKADDDGKRSGKFLSNSFNKAGEGFKKFLPVGKKALTGLGIGALAGGTLASAGVIPSMLSAGGPVGMGLIGLGLGIASSHKKFDEWMFGSKQVDKDGNVIGRNKDGMLGRFQNIMKVNVIEPIADSFKKNMLDMTYWMRQQIMRPFQRAFGPILDAFTGIKDNITDYLKEKLDVVGSGIMNIFKDTFKSIFTPFTNIVGKVGSGLLSATKMGAQLALSPIAGMARGAEFLTTGKRMKEYGSFYKDYYSGIGGRMKGYFAAKKADGEGLNIFDKGSEWIQALTGNGDAADAFRDGYNDKLSDMGKNSMGWRMSSREGKADKKQNNERKAEEKRWRNIDKLRKEIATKDLNGAELQLSDRMFNQYKKRFVKAGIDGDKLQSSDDIMNLLYRRNEFKNGPTLSAADANSQAMLANTSSYQDESLAKQDETIVAINNVAQTLIDISNAGGRAAADKLDRRLGKGFGRRQRTDRRILENQVKRMTRNGTLGSDKDKYNLGDNLYKYDLEGLTDADLMTYEGTNYYKNGDFEGWLTSIGRNNYAENLSMSTTNSDGTTKQTKIKGPRRFMLNADGNAVKSSTRQAPEGYGDQLSMAVSGDNFGSNLIRSLRENTNLQRLSVKIASGGKITDRELDSTSKTGTLNNNDARKLSSMHTSDQDLKDNNQMIIEGFNSINEANAEKAAEAKKSSERKAREAEESRQAEELGDETSFDRGWISTMFNTMSTKYGNFKDTKVGGVVDKGLKSTFSLMKLGLLGAAGAAVFELFQPGTTEKIVHGVTQFAEMVDSNPTFIADKIVGLFEVGTDKLFNAENGVLTTKVIPAMANFIGNTLPSVLKDYVIPGIVNTGTFLAENAGTLVSAFSQLIVQAGPPLISAIAKAIIPTITGLATGMWDVFTGKSDTKLDITEREKLQYEASGKNVKTSTKEVSEEEALQIQADGGTVEYKNGKYYTTQYDMLGENQYTDANGNVKTMSWYQSGGDAALGKAGRNAALNLVGTEGAGWISKLGSKSASSALAGIPKYAGGAIGAAGGALKGVGKGLLSAIKMGPVGAIAAPFTTAGGAIAGSISGARGGARAATSLASDIANRQGRTALSASIDATADSITNGASRLTDNVARSATEAATDSAVSKGPMKVIKEFFDQAKKTLNSFKSNKLLVSAAEALSKSGAGKIVVQLFDLVGSAIDKGIQTLASKGVSFITKIFNMIMGKSAEAGVRSAAGASSAGIMTLAFGIYDAVTGAFEANNLFGVAEPDTLMMGISSLFKTLLGFGAAPLFDLVLEVLTAITDYDIKKEWATAIYSFVINLIHDDDEASEIINSLVTQQAQLDIEAQMYNEIHGENVSTATYNDMKNVGVLEKWWINGWFGSEEKKAQLAEMEEIEAAAANYVASNGTTRTSQFANTEGADYTTYDPNLGYGKGAVGYGKVSTSASNNPYSQSNSKWANQRIGKFSDGTTATMADAGCGPTAMAAVANSLNGTNISPSAMGTYASKSGYITSGGANEGLFTTGAAKMGLVGRGLGGANDLQASLNTGGKAIIAGKSGSGSTPYTRAGHIVVATGMKDKNTVNVLDPMNGREKGYNINSLTNNSTHAWGYNSQLGYGDTNARVDMYSSRNRLQTSGNETTINSKSTQYEGINDRVNMYQPTQKKYNADLQKQSAIKFADYITEAGAISINDLKKDGLIPETTEKVSSSSYVGSEQQESDSNAVIDLPYLERLGASGDLGFFGTLKWIGDIIEASFNSMMNGTDFYTELNNLKTAEDDRESAFSHETINQLLVNPSSAADEILGKTIELMVAGESGGDYAAINLNDSGSFSIGARQLHGSKAKAFLTDLASRVTNTDHKHILQKYADKSHTYLTDNEAAELRSVLRDPDVEPISIDLQNQDLQSGVIHDTLLQTAAQWDSNYFNDQRSVVLPADIGNTGPGLLSGWFKNWQLKSRNYTKADELAGVKNSLMSTDSYWGRAAVTPEMDDYSNGEGWMDRIDRGYNSLSEWNPQRSTGRNLREQFISKADGLVGYGSKDGMGVDEDSTLDNITSSSGGSFADTSNYLSQILMAGFSGLTGSFGSDAISKLFTKSSNSSNSSFTGLSRSSTYDTTPVNNPSLGNGTAVDYFVKHLNGTMTSPFGNRWHPVSGTWKLHKGVDIGANGGTKIPSPCNGTVTFNGWDEGGYGWWIIITDTNGGEHIFGHLQEQSHLAVGSKVKIGDIVGVVGTTGSSTGNHLHYGINVKSQPVDPTTYKFPSNFDYTSQSMMNSLAGGPIGAGPGQKNQKLDSIFMNEMSRFDDDYKKDPNKYNNGMGGSDISSVRAELDSGSIDQRLDKIIAILLQTMNNNNNSKSTTNVNISQVDKDKAKREVQNMQNEQSKTPSQSEQKLLLKHASFARKIY